MTKTYLLAAAAVTALVAAGAAQAGSLSARAGAGGGAVAVAPNNPYRLARELNFGAGVASTVGQFDTVFTFNTPLSAGSYTVTLAYTGATITTALPTTAVNSLAAGNVAGDQTTASGFEVASAAGPNGSSQLTVVNQSSTQITFALQIPAGNTVTSIFAAPALLVTGPMSVTAAVTNQVTGAVVDPAVIQPLISTNNQGFAVRIQRTIGADGTAFGAGAGLDTRVAEGAAAPRFTTLTNPGQIGQVQVAVAGSGNFDTILGLTTASTPVYRDLNGSAVTLADVQSVTFTTTGIFAGLTASAQNDAGAPLAASAITTSGNTVTVIAPGGANVGTTTFNINTAPIVAGVTNPQIAPSDYDVSAQLALASGFTAPAATTGSFETLQTDGFTYIIPWVSSATQSGVSGNQSVIRISNIRSDASTNGGRVYVQVYNPTVNPQIAQTTGLVGTTGTAQVNSALVAGRSVFVGNLGTSGELVLSSQQLQNALGDFGRADLRLTITTQDTTLNALPGGATAAPPAATGLGSSTIVVKRLIATSNGGLTEVEVVAGDASSTANAPVNQGVPY